MFYIKMFLIFLWVGLCTLTIFPFAFFFGSPRLLPRFMQLISVGTLFFSGIKLTVRKKNNMEIANPCVYMSNHQSLFDVVTYCRYAPPCASFITKKEVRAWPLLGHAFAKMGVIFLDRKNREKAVSELERAAKVIQDQQMSVGMMPEGTRNLSGGDFLPFKKGGFHLAILAGVPIVPIVSSSLHEVVNVKERKLGGEVILEILDPIPTKGLSGLDVDRLCNTIRDAMVETYQTLNQDLSREKANK
jgi:1-acyl-sn-glycerol-3-phosphate acyltransferase